MSRKHSLSIAMCTFNGGRFLAQQLASIASQTRLPDELVICDDGSEDDTLEIIEKFASRNVFKVVLERNETNLGSTKNFERAIGMCNGDIVALADQDDVWLPNKLEVLESIFSVRPSVGLVFSDAEVVDQNCVSLDFRLWASIRFTAAQQKHLSNGRGAQVLLHHNVVTGATMAFRSKFRELVLPIPGSWIHDGWIALLISVFADLAFVREPLILYRKHEKQQSGPGPANRTFAGRLARARQTGADQYLALAQHFEFPRDRLVAAGDDPLIRAQLAYFEMRVKHLRARAEMENDANRMSRLPRVMRELLSRRYHLFSEGWESAVKDLLL